MDHWPEIARRWRLAGPPLRPDREDVRFYEAAVAEWIRDHGVPRVLVLGATPELFRLPWPEGTDLLAVDHTQAMIDVVWPGPDGTARRAEWTALPVGDGARDLALCDGGFHLLPHPDGQRRLVRELARTLSARGRVVVRLTVPPAQPESTDAVLADLLAGRIRSVDLFKLRMGMALQRDAAAGVAVESIWRAPGLAAEELAARAGWSHEHARSLEAYRGSPARYHYVTLDEAKRLFCEDPGGFALDAVRVPSYALGERCPTVVFRRAG